ncbi:MAG: hypothetical protein K5978_07605 [Campylobacter sp.]|nr:hypothetical protein [Campylobacter sp.]
MLWFFFCVVLLIAGYYTYGKFVEKVFGANDERATPVQTMADGVDYVSMFFWCFADIYVGWFDVGIDCKRQRFLLCRT